MTKNVIIIPATKEKYNKDSVQNFKRRRVAAYARVSTSHEEQQSSYEAQVEYYTNYIKQQKQWEFVSVYADEGITGCNTKNRDGFNSMIADALNNRIDLIITKSVSRFARNTVDSLTTIRKLKEKNVELLTIMSSLAQEESRSISENCTWGQRKRFADGKVTVPFQRFLGYDRGEDGNLVINEEQAKTIRKIYGLFLQGRSPYSIAKLLTKENILTPGSKKVWSQSTVKSILTNEKYKGDALLQKVYTVDFLSKKKKINEGEIPQYYVEGNHKAIIPPAIFDIVQKKIKVHYSGKNRRSSVGIFSGKIKCGDCGSWYGAKVWHSTDKYRRTVWQCNHKFDGQKKCSTPHLNEEILKELFVKAVNLLFTEKKKMIEDYNTIKNTIYDTSILEIEQKRLQQCMEKQNRKKAMEKFLNQIKILDRIYMEFDEDSWYSLIEYITIFDKKDIRFTFKNGVEIRV